MGGCTSCKKSQAGKKTRSWNTDLKYHARLSKNLEPPKSNGLSSLFQIKIAISWGLPWSSPFCSASTCRLPGRAMSSWLVHRDPRQILLGCTLSYNHTALARKFLILGFSYPHLICSYSHIYILYIYIQYIYIYSVYIYTVYIYSVYIYVHTYSYGRIYTHTYLSVYLYLYIYISIYLYIYISIYLYIYISIYLYLYIYTYIYIIYLYLIYLSISNLSIYI